MTWMSTTGSAEGSFARLSISAHARFLMSRG